MARAISKKYHALIKRFPLRPIRNDRDFAEAREIMTELAMRNDRTTDETDYLIMLGNAVSSYERSLPGVQAFLEDKSTPAEVLKFIMEENQFSQNGLAKEMEIDQGLISNFLSGKRSLSKANALKFAERFKVSVELFLDKPIVN